MEKNKVNEEIGFGRSSSKVIELSDMPTYNSSSASADYSQFFSNKKSKVITKNCADAISSREHDDKLQAKENEKCSNSILEQSDALCQDEAKHCRDVSNEDNEFDYSFECSVSNINNSADEQYSFEGFPSKDIEAPLEADSNNIVFTCNDLPEMALSNENDNVIVAETFNNKCTNKEGKKIETSNTESCLNCNIEEANMLYENEEQESQDVSKNNKLESTLPKKKETNHTIKNNISTVADDLSEPEVTLSNDKSQIEYLKEKSTDSNSKCTPFAERRSFLEGEKDRNNSTEYLPKVHLSDEVTLEKADRFSATGKNLEVYHSKETEDHPALESTLLSKINVSSPFINTENKQKFIDENCLQPDEVIIASDINSVGDSDLESDCGVVMKVLEEDIMIADSLCEDLNFNTEDSVTSQQKATNFGLKDVLQQEENENIFGAELKNILNGSIGKQCSV